MKDFLEKEGYANNEFDELTNNECTADVSYKLFPTAPGLS